MTTVGETLVTLCSSAKRELLLVAPFMKEKVLNRLVNEVNDEVAIVCITRWRPEEIKAGVSDLGVWSVINQRGNAKLFLMPTLHAKFYRSDNNCLVGSANLTQRALGWSERPNFELLVPMRTNEALDSWETELRGLCVEANESILLEIEKLVDLLDFLPPVFVDDSHDGGSEESLDHPTIQDLSKWLPSSRYPDLLFKAYSGRLEALTIGARLSAIEDLRLLNLPQGMDELSFNAIVGAMLLQMPMVHSIDSFLTEPRRFGEVRSLLRSRLDSDTSNDPSESWQTLMRWLRYFLPNRYNLSVPNYSEIVFRV